MAMKVCLLCKSTHHSKKITRNSIARAKNTTFAPICRQADAMKANHAIQLLAMCVHSQQTLLHAAACKHIPVDATAAAGLSG
jgi:hypothetical protein